MKDKFSQTDKLTQKDMDLLEIVGFIERPMV